MILALRRLSQDRWFSTLAVLVLALGIGSVTAVFSVVNGVLLRPLPYRDPGRLYVVQERLPKVLAQYPAIPVNAHHFDDWRRNCASCERLALLAPMSGNLTGDGEPERIRGVQASASLFPLLGAGVRQGRTFGEDDDKPGANKVAVIADSLWRRRFGATPDVIGRKMLLDGVPREVVGVLPPGFLFPPRGPLSALIGFPDRAEVFIPAALDFSKVRPMGNFNFAALARLKPGASPERAEEEMTAAIAEYGRQAGTEVRALLTPFKEMVTGKSERGLWLLLATVGAVLLIVCVNLGNLMLVRAHGRSRESAIRRALGASGRQVFGGMLAESLVLAAAGGALGVLITYAGVRVLAVLAPVDLPRLNEIRVDAWVLAFAFAVSALSGVLFGILPALKVTRVDLQGALKTSSRTATEGGSGLRARGVLVGIEVALSAALLVVAGLLGSSFSRLMRAERGFEVENILTTRLSPPQERYGGDEKRALFYQRLLDKLGQAPGIRYASLSNSLPLKGETWVDMVRKQGATAPVWELPVANIRFVGAAYFDAMGIALRQGRAFTELDRSRKVSVISESAARRVWPGENPVGKRFSREDKPKQEDWFEVIGVVADVRTSGLDKAPVPIVYHPYWANPPSTASIVLRTTADPFEAAGVLRAAVIEIDRDLPLTDLETMRQVLAGSVGQRKFQTTLAAVFSLAALMLACLGIYGVVSYTVARPHAGDGNPHGAGCWPGRGFHAGAQAGDGSGAGGPDRWNRHRAGGRALAFRACSTAFHRATRSLSRSCPLCCCW